MINPDIKIWCTYHMPEQITEYNIKETDIIKLFYSDNESLKEENINDLNRYLSEIVKIKSILNMLAFVIIEDILIVLILIL